MVGLVLNWLGWRRLRADVRRLWLGLLTDLWATKAKEPPGWYLAEAGEKPTAREGLLDECLDAEYEADEMGALRTAPGVQTSAQKAAVEKMKALRAELRAVEAAESEWLAERERRRMFDWPYEYARRVLENRDADV